MKARFIGAVLGVVITASLSFSHVAVAQDQNYYIVVGTFSSKDDAAELTNLAKSKYLDSSFVEDNNNLFQLHVLKTSSREAAIMKTMQLQRELSINEQRFPEPSAEALNTYADASSSKAVERNISAPNAMLRPKGKFFKFTISTPEGDVLPTKVHHVDFDRGVDVAAYNTEDYVDILRPGKNMPMTVVAGVFGYKEIEKFIDYSDPSATEGIYRDENGAWVIPYSLERLEKGDVSIMYNVAFHKDAVVMLPGSQKELDELVNMMQTNPNYVIKVHGHCNGKKPRKIIALGDHNNYFDVNGSNEINGTAKMLSDLRAEAIRTYLIEHGIQEERVKTYAWGGSYMLVDQDSDHARINDRIEIEILKD